MKSDAELNGIGGWLSLLVLGLTVLGPLMTLGGTMSEITGAERLYPALHSSSVWADVKVVSWCAAWLAAGVFIFAGITLIRMRRPEAVKIAIACLWFGGPIATLATLLIVGSLTGTSAISQPEAVGGLVKTIVYAGVWSAYLKMSRRVAITYSIRPLQP